MYKTQFKKWGLSKYMKALEKEKLIKVICELNEAIPFIRHDQLPKLGDMELRKLARYIKTELSKRSKKQRHHTTRRAGYLNAAEPLDEVGAYTNFGAFLTTASGNFLSDSTCQHEEFPAFIIHSSLLSPISFGLTIANSDVDMKFLLQSVQTSCSYFIPDCGGFSAAANVFWRNIKYAIHLFRIDSPPRALSALGEAYAAAERALLTADICSFVRNVLTTLSPVNTRACPYLRKQIIQRLTGIAQEKLGKYHPIAIVLQQLHFDGSTRDVSERCLAYMVEVATSSQDQLVLGAAIKAQLSISRLLRKDGEFDNAMRIAQHAHETAIAAFGHASVEACLALREQEHICINTENFMEALNICFLIMEQRGFDSADVRILTKEDIAYIYERLGDMGKRAAWLRQAGESARQLWGDCVATHHIIDKLGGLVARDKVI